MHRNLIEYRELLWIDRLKVCLALNHWIAEGEWVFSRSHLMHRLTPFLKKLINIPNYKHSIVGYQVNHILPNILKILIILKLNGNLLV